MDKKKLALTMAVATTLTVSSVSSSLPSVVYAQENENKIENEGNKVENTAKDDAVSKENSTVDEITVEEDGVSEEDSKVDEITVENESADEEQSSFASTAKIVEENPLKAENAVSTRERTEGNFSLDDWEYDFKDNDKLVLFEPRIKIDDLKVDTYVIPGTYDGRKVVLGRGEDYPFELYNEVNHTIDETKIQFGDATSKVTAAYIQGLCENQWGETQIDVTNLDVSEVKDMSNLFYNFRGFVEGFETWDTGNVTNMSNMFYRYENLVSIDALSNWNVSNVTDMSGMFNGCQYLESIAALENWNVSNVADMSGMFESCADILIVEPLKNWNVSNVTDMSGMFNHCLELESIDVLANWDVSAVTNMSDMFNNTNIKTLEPLRNWDVSNVTDMSGMFESCDNIQTLEPLKDWEVSVVTNMARMFKSCRGLQTLKDLEKWNVSAVTDMSQIFALSEGLQTLEGLETWDVSKVTDMSEMFEGCDVLSTLEALKGWNVSAVTNMSEMFYGCDALSTLEPLQAWNVSAVTNMDSMFIYCKNLQHLKGLENWDVSSVTDMVSMFEDCLNLKTVKALKDWNVSSVETMRTMFYKCRSLPTLEGLEGWSNKLTKLKDVSGMFFGNLQLKDLQPISNWDTQAFDNIGTMFAMCPGLTSLHDIQNWNTENVTNMEQIFMGCINLESASDIQNWNTDKVTNMQQMFSFCTSLKSFSLGEHWTLPSLKKTDSMFAWCLNLETVDFGQWQSQQKNIDMTRMFLYCPKLSVVDLSKLNNVKDLDTQWCLDTNTIRNYDFATPEAEKLDAALKRYAEDFGVTIEIPETDNNPLMLISDHALIKERYNQPQDDIDGFYYGNKGRVKYAFNVTYNGNGRTLTNGKETADDVVTATNFVYSTKEDVTNDFVKQINDKGNALVQNAYVEWYLDKECTKPVSEFDFTDIKHKDITLYAKYSVQVDYEFISPYDDMELPQDVLKQLPKNSVVEAGSTVKPITSKFEKVQDGNGYWEFDKWDKEEIKNIQEHQTLKGTWVYKESGLVMNTAPVINVGDKTLTVGDKFDELAGVTVMDKEEGELTDKIEVLKNTVDTDKVGVYEVTYKVTDSKGASATKTIYVTVNPKMEALNEVPTISASDKTLTVGDKFEPLKDVIATDKEDGELTDKIEVLKNTVDTNKAGVYEVTYKVTDSNGATVTKTITVTVKEKNVVTPITPEKPNDTVKPDNTTKPNKTDTPQTGDMTNLGVFATMLTATLAILAVMLGKRYKINKK